MGKKIIVAGGGHGGITAGMLLAQKGFDVTVYEKNTRKKMGHDWTDVFHKEGFGEIGLDVPENHGHKPFMSFYSPDMETVLREETPEDKLEIQMERKEIYDYIIEKAEQAGVKFVYSCAVEGPILFGNRVVGIKTAKGDKYADLIIDACGMDSPVRRNLPAYLGVQNEADKNECFYVFRAFYDRTDTFVDKYDRYKVVMLCENKMGINWVLTEDDYADILIGRFEEFDKEEADRTVEYLRQSNPVIGKKLRRGGQFVKIPVRQPLGVMVADGYAAIGDSAFMTIPIIGSGIANSFAAAKILAETILDDENGAYSAESLWKYQCGYYKKIGATLAPLANVKLMLTSIEGEELDYIFKTKILTGTDMTNGVVSPNVPHMVAGLLAPSGLRPRIEGLAKNKPIVSKIMKMGTDLAKTVAVTAAMPREYNRKAILRWVKEYNECFKS